MGFKEQDYIYSFLLYSKFLIVTCIFYLPHNFHIASFQCVKFYHLFFLPEDSLVLFQIQFVILNLKLCWKIFACDTFFSNCDCSKYYFCMFVQMKLFISISNFVLGCEVPFPSCQFRFYVVEIHFRQFSLYYAVITILCMIELKCK